MNGYEICISRYGKHLFSTQAIPEKVVAIKVYFYLKQAFIPEKGYKITMTEWKNTGKTIYDS